MRHEIRWSQNLLIYLAGPVVNLAAGLVLAAGYFGYTAWRSDLPLGTAVLRTLTSISLLLERLVGLFSSVLVEFIPSLVLGAGFHGPWGIHDLVQGMQNPAGFIDVIGGLLTAQLVVGLFNLIPFPGLDGFGVIGCLYEGITGRVVPRSVSALGQDMILFGLLIGTLCLFLGRNQAIYSEVIRIPENRRLATLNVFGLLVLSSVIALRALLQRDLNRK